ncbi:MAG: hypothetical protein IJ651_04725 [Bacteroidales bacterium]|nr:hypothetical protein [Bacteroidales bacterium]
MLEGLLYQTVELQPEPLSATVRLLPESPVYKAHFPGYPITPGVTLVQMGLELLGALKGRSFRLAGAKGIKFLVPVLPAEDTRLRYVFADAGDGNWNIDLLAADGTLCARMQCFLEPAQNESLT